MTQQEKQENLNRAYDAINELYDAMLMLDNFHLNDFENVKKVWDKLDTIKKEVYPPVKYERFTWEGFISCTK